jgi:hypothetical protein
VACVVQAGFDAAVSEMAADCQGDRVRRQPGQDLAALFLVCEEFPIKPRPQADLAFLAGLGDFCWRADGMLLPVDMLPPDFHGLLPPDAEIEKHEVEISYLTCLIL